MTVLPRPSRPSTTTTPHALMSFLSRHRQVVIPLRLFWVVLILWYEYFTFWASVRSCGWPDQTSAGLQNTEGTSPAHILVVADPQILDHRSYPDRPAFLTYLTRLVVDLNLKKNWNAAISKSPDSIIFLGDMMDGGRMDMSDSEYEEYYNRFKKIFREDKIPQFFIPGNHDIGLQTEKVFSPQARQRYISHFGPLNNKLSVANHTLLLFDAPGFVQEDSERGGRDKSFTEWRPKKDGPFEFVRKVHEENDLDPVVLLTHIPLYRPDGRPCGPLREKGTVRPGVGFGYQNTLGKHSTAFLLDQVRPTVVFSGDDHDYCEHTHQSVISHPVREITVKSLSMAMNVRKPGFQLLTLFPPEYWDDLHPTYADVPCLLPDQIGIYVNVYVPFLLLSLCIVICAAIVRMRRLSRSDLDHFVLSTQPTHLPDPVTKLGRSATSAARFGHRRRLPLGLGYLFGGKGTKKYYRRSIWEHVLHDVCDIAVFPVGIFIAVTIFVWL